MKPQPHLAQIITYVICFVCIFPFTLMEKRQFQEGHKNGVILSLSVWEDVYPESRYGVWNGTWFWWWWGGRWYVLSMTHWLEETTNISRKWDPRIEVRFEWHKKMTPKEVVWKYEEKNYSGKGDYITWREEWQGHNQNWTSTFHCKGLPTMMQAPVLDAALPDPSNNHAFPHSLASLHLRAWRFPQSNPPFRTQIGPLAGAFSKAEVAFRSSWQIY